MSKYLVITGGSQGIGKSIIECFIQRQWKIINISRHPSTVNDVKNITLDLTELNWPIEKISTSLSSASQICLVHNSAMCPSDTVFNIDESEMRKTFELNVVAPARLNTIVLPLMQKGSSIIYIGSTLSEIGVPHTASYIASKHAIAGLMKATCQDLDNSGIHTCCICPGLTETNLLRGRMQQNPGLSETIKQHISARRFVKPEEIAAFVWFCANNPAINGSVLHANLGMVMR